MASGYQMYKLQRARNKICCFFVLLLVIGAMLVPKFHFHCARNDATILPPDDEPHCVHGTLIEQSRILLHSQHLIPSCHNVLSNLTNGSWIELKDSNSQQEKLKLDALLHRFRVQHEGFSGSLNRSDHKCGFSVPVNGPVCSLTKADMSAWCDPRGSRPCCTDINEGHCVSKKECEMFSGINLAKYSHAEISSWIPADARCKYIEHTKETACQLLHAREVRSIGFVGNSLMRNMYSTMLQLLTGNLHNGSVINCIPTSLRKRCVGPWQNMDKYCLASALAPSSDDLPRPGICNGQLDLKLHLDMFWVAKMGSDLKDLVSSLLDKRGSYLLIGIGVHDAHDSKVVIRDYLKPSVEILQGRAWPKVIWVHSPRSGIYKPSNYVAFHGNDVVIDAFARDMEKYCKKFNILTLDIRALTTGVWSIEGTHYGTGVNMLKNQIFLNFLATL